LFRSLYLSVAVAAAIVICLVASVRAHADSATSDVAVTLGRTRVALGQVALQRGGSLVIDDTVIVNGLPGTGTSTAEIGGARLSERTVTPPLAAGDGYDGTSFWNQDQTGLVWVDGSTAGVSQEIDEAYIAGDALFVSGSDGARVAWGGARTTAGRHYLTLVVTPRRSLLPIQVWIDTASHLPVRYVVSIGPVTYETDVTDYRLVNGLMVPYRIVSSNDGNASALTVTSAHIIANDDTSFVRPHAHVEDFSIQRGGDSTSVPITLIDQHVYLDVMLDGKGPYRFVLDTGGSNVIDPVVAKDIAAAGSGATQDSGTGSQTQTASFATIGSLAIGNALLKHQVFLVEPIHKAFGKASGERVDGIIGFEVLARYVATIDYANRTLTLAMPHAQGASEAGADVLPFVFYGTVPQIGCDVDGVSSQCSVDTGAAGSADLFVPFLHDFPQVIPKSHSAVGVNGIGVGGGHRGFMGRLRSLQIGQFTLHDLVAGFSTQAAGAFAAPFLAANLGGGVWKRFTVTFDYGTQTMVLRPNANLDAPDDHDRSGLLLVDEAGKIVVYAVREGTPAATSGLRKGDVILSIGGVAPTSLEHVRDDLQRAPGTVLHVRIADRNGANRTVTLTLRNWV
jgi:hypothetical protein